MKWPLISRRRHMRDFTELSQAYQEEIRVARYERDTAENRLREWTAQFVRHVEYNRSYERDSSTVLVEMSNHLIRHSTPFEMETMLSREIMRQLHRAQQDWRGDGRDSRTKILY